MAGVAVVFPGQGSQFVGMGREFHEASDDARRLMDLAGEKSGLPLTNLCFEGPLDDLTRTVNLQPAVTAVNLICWKALVRAGVKPDAAAGHSLGEYSALAAAGVLTEARCLELVTLRGRLMDRDAAANPGAMSAIVGAKPEEVAGLCREAGGLVQPANYNTPAQTVITGSVEAVAEAGRLATERGLKSIPLKVSGAWHSPLMTEAGRDMAQALEKASFAEPGFPVYTNLSGKAAQDAGEISRDLTGQLTSPVRWVQTVEAMSAAGIDVFIECGPKTVLSGLIKKTLKDARVFAFQDPEGLEKVLAGL